MKAATIAWTAPGTADCLRTAQHINTASRSFRASLLGIPQKLLQALATCKRMHVSSDSQRTPPPPCPYAMLVESDVQRGIRGVLP